MSRCFYINLPIGGLAAGVILLTFKTPPAVKQVVATRREKLLQMDFAGTALVMGGSLTLLLALQYGGVAYPWNSGVVIGLFVSSSLMVVALVALEMWLGERAMLTPRLICQRTVWVNSIWGFFFAGSYFVTLYFLPIYFQSIDNRSPIGSGVRQIPLIVLFSVSTLASGRAITKTGVAAPYLVAGSVIATIAAGLLFTLDIGTSTGKWVGYQILAGFGYGIAFQVPITIVQAHAAPSDIALVTSIILCKFLLPCLRMLSFPRLHCILKLTVSCVVARCIGATFLITAAQSGFINQILHELASTAPNIEPSLVTATGATALREVFSGADLDAIIHAYAWGIKMAFAISIAACGITTIVSLCTRWANVNAKKASA
jgi:hypothetical protein